MGNPASYLSAKGEGEGSFSNPERRDFELPLINNLKNKSEIASPPAAGRPYNLSFKTNSGEYLGEVKEKEFTLTLPLP